MEMWMNEHYSMNQSNNPSLWPLTNQQMTPKAINTFHGSTNNTAGQKLTSTGDENCSLKSQKHKNKWREQWAGGIYTPNN